MKKLISLLAAFTLLLGCAVLPAAAQDKSDWSTTQNPGGGDITIQNKDGSVHFKSITDAFHVNKTPVDITAANVEITLGTIPAYNDVNSAMSSCVSFSNRNDVATEYGTRESWDGVMLYFYYTSPTMLTVDMFKNTEGAIWTSIGNKAIPMDVLPGTKLYVSLQEFNGAWQVALNGTQLIAAGGLVNLDKFSDGKGYIQVGSHASENFFPIEYSVTRFDDAAGNAWSMKYTNDKSFYVTDDNGTAVMRGESSGSYAIRREPVSLDNANLLFSIDNYISFAGGSFDGKPQQQWQVDIDFSTSPDLRNGFCIRLLPWTPDTMLFQVVNYDNWAANAWPYNKNHAIQLVDGTKFFFALKEEAGVYNVYINGEKLALDAALPAKDFQDRQAYIWVSGTNGAGGSPIDVSVYEVGNSGVMTYDKEVREEPSASGKTVSGQFSAYNNLPSDTDVTYALAAFDGNKRMTAFDAQTQQAVVSGAKTGMLAPQISCAAGDSVKTILLDNLDNCKPVGESAEYVSSTLTAKAGVLNNQATISGDLGDSTAAAVVVKTPSGAVHYANLVKGDGTYSVKYPMDTQNDEGGTYTVIVNGNKEAEKRVTSFFFAGEALSREIVATANTGTTAQIDEMFRQYYPVFNIELEEYQKEIALDTLYQLIIANRPFSSTDGITQVVQEAPLVAAFNSAAADGMLALLRTPELEADFTKYNALYSDTDRKWVLEKLDARSDYKSFADINSTMKEYVALAMLNRAGVDDLVKYLKDKDMIAELGIGSNEVYLEYLSYTGTEKKSIETGLVKKQPYESVKDFLSKLSAAIDERTKPSDGGSGGSSGGGGGNRGGSTVKLPATTPAPLPTNTPEDEYSGIKTAFDDIGQVEWAYPAIQSLYEKKIISGSGDGKLHPTDVVTREEFVKMLVVAADALDETASCNFGDVAEGQWFYRFVASAVNAGLVNGVSEQSFGTGAPVTRQDAAVMLERAIAKKGIALASKEGAAAFRDADQIAAYAQESVEKLRGAGILNGKGDGTFAPADYCTRAEVFQMIYAYTQLENGVEE